MRLGEKHWHPRGAHRGPSGASPQAPPAAPGPGPPGGTPACRPHTQTVRFSFPEKMAPPSGEQSTE